MCEGVGGFDCVPALVKRLRQQPLFTPGVNSDTELKCNLISAPKGMTTTKYLELFLVLNEGPPNLLVLDMWLRDA